MKKMRLLLLLASFATIAAYGTEDGNGDNQDPVSVVCSCENPDDHSHSDENPQDDPS